MLFDLPQRVIYKRNPLAEVVCQVRFAPLLAVSAQLPAAFQTRLRDRYPLLSVAQGLSFQVSLGSTSQPPQQTADPTYTFSDSSAEWSVNLSKESVTLRTTAYKRWEDFRQRWIEVCAVFDEIYGRIAVTRLGLRYQDIIDPDKLGLRHEDSAAQSWARWIKASVLGVLSDPHFAQAEEYFSTTLLPLSDGASRVALRTGIAQNNITKAKAFMVDADFYVESTPALLSANDELILAQFDSLHAEAGGLFRWCITDTLHRELEPEPVDS